MSKGIDYSKWNHFGESDSSEEEEESVVPRVTRLDAPSQVSAVDGSIQVVSTTDTPSTDTPKKHHVKSNSIEDVISEWTSKGSTVQLESANDSTLYWCQDRESVTIRIEIPPNTSASDIEINLEGAVSAHDKTSATLTRPRPTLSIRIKNTTLIEGTLPYPVHLEEEDGILDWTLESVNDKKYIVVTLSKATPMPGMTLWWTRPFQEMEEQIQLEQTSGLSSFQRAWKEAHVQFKEKIQEKKNQTDGMLVQDGEFSIEELEE